MLGHLRRSPPSSRPALDAGLGFFSTPDKISQAPCQARGDDEDVAVFKKKVIGLCGHFRAGHFASNFSPFDINWPTKNSMIFT